MPISLLADAVPVDITPFAIAAVVPIFAGLGYGFWVLARHQAVVQVKTGTVDLAEVAKKLPNACRAAAGWWLALASLKIIALGLLFFATSERPNVWLLAIDASVTACLFIAGTRTLLESQGWLLAGVWVSGVSVLSILPSLPSSQLFALIALAIPGYPFVVGCQAAYLVFQKRAAQKLGTWPES